MADVIIETPTLINFLRIGRVDLLAGLVAYRFLVTDHVRSEVTTHYPAQLATLDFALLAGHLGELSLTDLRRAIGIVSEETFLFSASVRDNIAFGAPEATDEDVERAARRGEIRGDCDIQLESSLIAGPLFYRRMVSREPISRRMGWP